MLKYLALLAIASQALAGYFPPGLEALEGIFKRSSGLGPQQFDTGLDKKPRDPTMGTSGIAIGGFNKRIGLAHANVAKYVKAAEDEVEAKLNFLKSSLTTLRATPCGSDGQIDTLPDDIRPQLEVAFEPCKMKNELAHLRLHSAQMKRQMATNKMAKKDCYANPDPAACVAGLDNEGGYEAADRMVDELKSKFFACLRETKGYLLHQIENAYEELLYC